MEIRLFDKESANRYVDELIAIDSKCFNEKPYYAAQVWGANNFLLDLDYKWKLSQIALVDDSQVVGALIASKYSDNYCHINRIFVSPNFRNKGIASSLLNQFEIRAIGLGLVCCTLFVNVANIETIAFYEKKGWIKSKDKQFELFARLKNRKIENNKFIYDEKGSENLIYYKEFIISEEN